MLLIVRILAVAGPAPASESGLPEDFRLSPVSWGGYGGGDSQSDCGSITHYPVVLVHGSGDGPEVWRAGDDGGVVAALQRGGFDPCEVWALKVGDAGRPMRSLEELTDDVKFFVHSVLGYTRAPQVQLVGDGAGAALIHTTLKKYHLYPLVHSAVYIDGPFAGQAGCDDDRCFAGEVVCCALTPGSAMLRRVMLPVETPEALTSVPDHGREGHIRYLALGSTPAVALEQRTPEAGGWMLDGASNLSFSEIAGTPVQRVAELWPALSLFLSDPASPCSEEDDGDRDGFCDVARGGNDCDDRDPSVFPGAMEVERDGKDQDCNLHDLDRSVVGWKCERPIGAAQHRLPPLVEPPDPPDTPAGMDVPLVVAVVAVPLLLGFIVLGIARKRIGRKR